MLYVIVTVRIHDRSWVRTYHANVPRIVASYGGRYLATSASITTVEGTGPAPDMVGILTFPDKAALDACMGSAEYAPYLASRQGRADTDVIAFDYT